MGGGRSKTKAWKATGKLPSSVLPCMVVLEGMGERFGGTLAMALDSGESGKMEAHDN